MKVLNRGKAVMRAMLLKSVPTTVYSAIVRIHLENFLARGYILLTKAIDWLPKIIYLCDCCFL